MTPSTKPISGVAYYTAADARFFPGVVALLDSLRLVGEVGPVFVVDCGLTDAQRARLGKHVTLVPTHKGLHPVLQKATGPLAHPAELMVIVDSDVIVTRPLGPLLADAAAGNVVGFEDRYFADRSFDEWSAFGLGTPSRRRYVNGGLLVVSAATADALLPKFVELQERLDPTRTHFGGAPKATEQSNPFYFADQDVLNALFSTQFAERIVAHEYRLAPVPPFEGLEVLNDDLLACRYSDGARPFALHHIMQKPWLSPLERNAYSEILRRVVDAPEAAIRLGSRDLPLRLTNSRLAVVDRAWVSARRKVRAATRGKLGLRPLVERRVQRLRAGDDTRS